MLNVKCCHYFNNEKLCPFEEIGCMFRHAESKNCRFKQLCKIKLCQFQHKDQECSENGTLDEKAGTNVEGVETIEMDQKKCEKPVTEPARVTCKICFRYLNTNSDLENHMKEEHKNSEAPSSYFFHTLDSEEEEEEEEEEDLECEDCGKVSDNFDEYIEHRGIGDCAFYCNPCNQTFRFEKDLKIHTEKHCTKCGEEFSPANILKTHKRTCK